MLTHPILCGISIITNIACFIVIFMTLIQNIKEIKKLEAETEEEYEVRKREEKTPFFLKERILAILHVLVISIFIKSDYGTYFNILAIMVSICILVYITESLTLHALSGSKKMV